MSGAPAATGGATAIRRAGPGDLAAIAQLLTQRDARTWDVPSAAWFLQDLDPGRCLAWIAWAGEHPIGLTSFYVRDLQVGPQTVHAAYWANLYIDPAFRDRMLYPRLPLAMFPELKRAGVRFTYAAVRRADVALAHRSIGFVPIGAWPLRVKPLRPLRLIARTRHVPLLGTLGAPFDAAFAALATAARPAPGTTVEPIPLGDSTAITDLVQALDPGGGATIRSNWDTARFQDRYSRTREGGHYEATAVRSNGQLRAALIHRIGERPPDLTVGVIMDTMTTGDPEQLRGAIGIAERHAKNQGCDAMLYLDSQGPEIGAVFKRAGYLPSPERYELLVHPKAALEELPDLANFAAWRYSFGDHDAF